MAQRNSSGRGGTATKRRAGNQSPATPGISESELSRLRVDEIRMRLRRLGVTGVSALRKPDLVKTLARSLRSGRRTAGAGRTSTGPAGRATGTGGGRKAGSTATTASRKAGSTSPAAKAGPTASARKTTSSRKAAPTRKATSTRATSTRAASGRAASTRAASGRGATAGRTGVRTGRSASRSVSSSQVITSLADRPERPGRSLVTTNHEVIRRWASARNAKPATISGTERDGRPGVLTFNLPGYRESSRLREVTWAEWFQTFDSRRLNLIYQEQLRDGRQSNFFRTESPQREDA
ncbi:hypothetical protein [Micromonospora sp. SH-82]|uniref:hypothetical protein n=1 Tax=Micromonospora sp. SH-82 TaxID=3132938 RepID=UPI003EBBC6DA